MISCGFGNNSRACFPASIATQKATQDEEVVLANMILNHKHLRLLTASALALLLVSLLVLLFLWNNPGLVAKKVSEPLVYSPSPIPSVEMECFSKELPISWSYCLNSVPFSTNNTIVYHFHGRRGNESWWNDDTYYTGDLYREWSNLKIDPPIVVSVSYGPLWLLDSNNLMEVFLKDTLPEIESNIEKPISNRLVVGESMGGVNAILLWLSAGEMFEGAASLCPPLPTITPQASFADMFAYLEESNTTWQKAAMMIVMGRYLFPDEESWAVNNPIEVAKNTDFGSKGPLYLSCGAKDDWGCMLGSNELKTTAMNRGANVLWHPRPGGHCDIDNTSLAKFLGSNQSFE